MPVELVRRHLLLYDYPADVLERREPHRAGHIAQIREWMADGRLLMAGAVGDPPSGGLFVFASGEPVDAETFAATDPYVASGVVTGWRVEAWNTVS